MFTKYKFVILFIAVMITFVGCKDNGTDADPGEPPSLPELQKEEAQMDVSFFEENNPKSAANIILETNNFNSAKNVVLGFSGAFATSQLYEGFLQPVNGAEATFEDGVWEWTYSYNYEGVSVEIRTTAQEIGENIEWAMYWSYDDGEGNSYNDYKIFEGTVSKDGTTGTWSFNILDPEDTQEVPGLKYSWEIISDTEVNLTAELFDGSGNSEATITYEENQPDYMLDVTYHGDSSNENTVVYWNTETNEGYIEKDGTRCNWDSNFQDTSCLE
jgi:hypothetical protein